MKAEIRHGPTRDGSREGRGLPTSRSTDENSEDLKHREDEANRLRKGRDEMYDWYTEAFDSYKEELKRGTRI